MEKKPMKRVNVILEAELYDKARVSCRYLARCDRMARAIFAEWIEGLPDKGDIR
jgi:hypothetical protein